MKEGRGFRFVVFLSSSSSSSKRLKKRTHTDTKPRKTISPPVPFADFIALNGGLVCFAVGRGARRQAARIRNAPNPLSLSLSLCRVSHPG